MEIAPALARASVLLNTEQRAIVSHKCGPLLVVAGPGSGKTRSLTLLAMNLLLCGDAEPAQIVLCTYTEKAAYELQDRLTSIARDVNYAGDISRLRVGTIHGICQRLVNEHLHHTSLGSGYETLDNFTQQLLIFDRLEKICPKNTLPFFQDRWGTRWQVAKRLKFYFDTIAEELAFDPLKADIERLKAHQTRNDTLLHYLTYAYDSYRSELRDTNSTDFAHLQKWAYKLLKMPDVRQKIIGAIRYVLVDEYQDTNYIQEQILTLLASGSDAKNLVVIGDEDQALYRFRGATVRNILTFTAQFPGCKQIHLTTNYRSQTEIITACNRWIKDFDWSNGAGPRLRTEKIMQVSPSQRPDRAMLRLEAVDIQDEAEQFADLVDSLKKQEKIDDYSDVALLLHSVRSETSEPYMRALLAKNIPVYCPRARAFFDQEEIQIMLGCFARILQYSADRYSPLKDDDNFSAYLADCQQAVVRQAQRNPALARELRRIGDDLQIACDEETFDGSQLAEYFYRIMFEVPSLSSDKRENKHANLVWFSRLIEMFQGHYRHRFASGNGLEAIGVSFFEQFFAFLHLDGVNEDGDQQRPLQKGCVQIMTIHQAKGLEFPVVVVGRLDKPRLPTLDKERFILQPYFSHRLVEPAGRIPGCDRRRLYYVALSRARDLLVLSAARQPDKDFREIWQSAPAWKDLRAQPGALSQHYDPKEESVPPKARYGFTTHVQTYRTCPRRYQYFYEHQFSPSRPADVFFGQLVHQTIEHLHRQARDGFFGEERVHKTFDKIYVQLSRTSAQPVALTERERALRQVLHYYQQNQREMQHIHAAEFPVEIDREKYILRGKIDLLVEGESGLEVVDFKTQARPAADAEHLVFYKRQLALYAHALQKRNGQLPRRLWLYWTAEERKEDALMEVACDKESVEREVGFVDELVAKIQNGQFHVQAPPKPEICQKCDIRHLCHKQGIIT